MDLKTKHGLLAVQFAINAMCGNGDQAHHVVVTWYLILSWCSTGFLLQYTGPNQATGLHLVILLPFTLHRGVIEKLTSLCVLQFSALDALVKQGRQASRAKHSNNTAFLCRPEWGCITKLPVLQVMMSWYDWSNILTNISNRNISDKY